MKKLLTVLAASVGIAAFADTAPLSATSFEGYDGDFSVTKGDAGGEDAVPSNDRTWAGDADADGDTNVITAYGDATPPENRPDYYSTSNQVNFLKVDSTAGLARYVKKGGVAQDLTSNVYFDMDVQFTVSDSVQEPAEDDGDKLLVWLYAPDTENAQTNLIITAATLDETYFTPDSTVNYIAGNVTVQPDTWYRLTVVSEAKEVAQGVSVPVFKVYINETLVESTTTLGGTGSFDAISEFNSLVAYSGTGGTTLTSVTFKGTGAVDDLVVTTVKPSFIQEDVLPFAIGDQPYETFAAALADAEVGDVIKVMANYNAANEEGDTLLIDTDITLDLGTFTLSGEYPISVDGGVLTLLGTGSVVATEDDIYIASGSVVLGNASGVPAVDTIIVEATEVNVKRYGAPAAAAITIFNGDGNAITGTWEAEAGETGYYVFTAGGDEPSSTTKVIDPTTESISAAGTIEVPAGTTNIELEGVDVTAGFTIKDTIATLKTPVIEATADTTDEDTKDEALVVTDTEVKIGVKAVKGLYYGVGSNTDVTKVARPVELIKFTGNRAEIFTKAKTENADGEFYKVYVDIKAK